MYALMIRFLPKPLATLLTGLWLYALMMAVLYLGLRYDLAEFGYWRI